MHIKPKASACHQCGLLIANHCGNKGCKQPLDGNARFCVACGDMSIYYKEGFLEDWNEELEDGRNRRLAYYVFKDADLEAFDESY